MKRTPNIFAKHIPVLEIGDTGIEVSDEVVRRANIQTKKIKGRITFLSDGSKCDGLREIVLGEPIYYIGSEVVKEVMFLPYEYFAPLGSE